ncbi:MAG: filamentous hemagglutinin N-terminal domain-containing protein [Phycisphaeraceae bacterium]|nr:filamentous hemagglutinin N-terminal domain-containing protein [Phycisphaeraceae bacterium]
MTKRTPTPTCRTAWRRAGGGVLVISPFLSALSGPPALAGPDGARVVHGTASFSQQGATTVIHTSHTAVINYNSFGIAAHETVRFIQPDASSRVLNRVTGSLPTHIDGALLANGRVYITNPAGVYFGDGALVNAGAIYAAAGSITNADFIRGIDRFYDLKGEVVNRGVIQADAAYLLGGRVANFGRIIAEGGVVMLASADEVLIGESGSNVYARVSKPANGAPSGVENAGEVRARRARIGAGDVYGVVLFDSSRIKADHVTVESAATTLVAGEIDASNRAPGGKGGRVELLGDRVGVTNARVDASGDAGGGAILVGGELQGGGTTRRAAQTVVTADSSLTADALTVGDGGTIILWADDATRFHGSISARGGAHGGDGGFAEISGKRSLTAKGAVDLGAANGASGTLLYDPDAIVIIGGSADGSDTPDASATNLETDGGNAGEVLFADIGDATEPFEVYQSEIEGTDANIVLEAGSSITVSGTFDNAELLVANNRNLTLRTRNKSGQGDSAGGIDLTGSTHGADLTVRTQGTGAITLHAGYEAANLGSEAGDLASGLVVGRLTTGGGAVELRTGSSGGGTVSILGDVIINGAGAFSLYGDAILGGDLRTNGGAVSFLNSTGVTLISDVVIDTDAPGGTTDAGGVLFATGAAINGPFRLTVDATADGGGASSGVSFLTIGSPAPLTGLEVSAAVLLLSSDISVDGGGSVDLTGSTTVTLAANIRIDTDAAGGTTSAGSVLFDPAGFVNGLRTLTIDATADGGGTAGVVTLGALGAGTRLQGLEVSAASLTLNGVILLNTGGAVNLAAVPQVTLGADVHIDTDSIGSNFHAGNVVFSPSGTVDGPFSLTIDATADGLGSDGTVTLGTLGSTVPLAGIEIAAASLALHGGIAIDGGGDVNLAEVPAVTLAGNVIIDTDAVGGVTDAGNVHFAHAGAVNGPYALTIDATADGGGAAGAVTLGALGMTQPLAGLAVSADALSLYSDVALDGGGDVNFSGASNVLLAADVTIRTDAAGGTSDAGAVLFATDGTVNGQFALTLDTTADGGGAAGSASMGEIGGTLPLTSLTIAADSLTLAGDIALDGGGNADLTAVPVVTLAADVHMATDAPGGLTDAGDVLFATDGTINGGFSLTIDATADGGGAAGAVSLGSVGTTTRLNAIEVAAAARTLGGDLRVNGGGDVDLAGSPVVTLVGPVTIDTDAPGGNDDAGSVLFANASTIDGAYTLAIDATADGSGSHGDINLGAVGTGSPLLGFTVAGASLTINGDLRTDSGDVDLSGLNSVVVANSLVIDTEAGDDASAGRVLLAGPTVAASAPGLTLSIDASTAGAAFNGGAVELGGFGSTTAFALGVLAVSDAGGAGADHGGLTLTGSISVGQADFANVRGTVQAHGAVSITTADTTVDLSGAAGIQGHTAGLDSLAVNAGAGDVLLPPIGATTRLGGLTVATTGTLTLRGDVLLTGGAPVDLTAAPSVLLTADVLIDTDAPGGASNAGSVLFAPGGTIDGAFALTIDARADGGGSGGAVSLGAVGGSSRLTGLTVSSASLALGGGLAVDGGGTVDLSGAGAVTLVGHVVIDTDAPGGVTDAGSVLFAPSGVLDGAFTLTIDATADGGGADGTVVLGAVGASARLTGLAVSGAALTLNGDVRTDGGNIDLSGSGTIAISQSIEIDSASTPGLPAGHVDITGTNVSATVSNLSLTIDTSAAGAAGGAVSLGDFSDAAGAYVHELTVRTGGTNAGDLHLAGSVLIRNEFTLIGGGDVVIAAGAHAMIDTNPDGVGDAGSILLGSGRVYAAGADASLTLDASSSAVGGSGGSVTIGPVDDGGGAGFYLTGLSIDATGGPERTPGSVGLSNDVIVDGDVVFSGVVVLGASVTIDTNPDDIGASGLIDLSGAIVTASAAGFDLTLVTSSDDDSGGQVHLADFGALGGFYVNDLTIHTGGTTAGLLTLTASVFLDADGPDTGDFTLTGGGAIAIASAAAALIDTNSTAAADAGSINLGSGLIYALGAGATLTLDTRSTDGLGGAIAFGEIGAGPGQRLEGFTARSSGGAGSGVISIANDIDVAGDILFASDVQFAASVGLFTGGGSIDFSGATVSASAAGVDLTLDSSNGAGAGGDVRLGIFSNNGGHYINDLAIDTSGSTTNGALRLFGNLQFDNHAGNPADLGSITLAGGGDVVIHASITIDTKAGATGDVGAINFGASNFYAASPALTLTLDTTTADGAGAGGAITFGRVDDGSGAGAFFSAFTADSRGGASSGAITLADDLLADGAITLAGNLRIGASLAIDTEQGDNGSAGTLDLTNAVISATGAGFTLSLDTSTTAAAATAGNVLLGRADDSGGAFLTALNIDTRAVSGTAGSLVLNGSVQALAIGLANVTGAVTVAADSSLTTTNSDINLGNSTGINGAGTGEQTLALSAGTGAITLPGVGQTTALGSFSTTTTGAGSTILNGDVTTAPNGGAGTTGNQTYAGTVTLGGTRTLRAGTGTISFADALQAGANDLTLIADGIEFNGAATGTGILSLRPSTDATSIGLAGAAGTLQLSATTLGNIGPGFSEVRIGGQTTGAHTITINSFAIDAPLRLFAPDGLIVLSGTITTSGDAVRFTGPVRLGAAAGVVTTNGVAAGANITFDETLTGTTADTQSLTLDAGTGGDILFSAAVGATRLGAVTITNTRDLTASSTFVALSITQTDGQGLTTFADTLTASGAGGVSLTGNQFSLAAVSALAGGVSVQSRIGLTAGAITAGGAVSLALDTDANDAGATGALAAVTADSITLSGSGDDVWTLNGLLNATGPGGITIGGGTNNLNADVTADAGPVTITGTTIINADREIFAGSGTLSLAATQFGATTLTLTADEIDLTGGASSITGTGSIFLRPTGDAVSIDVGSPAGGTGTLDLSDTDMAAIASTVAGVTIGRVGTGAHEFNIGSLSVTYPITFASPNGLIRLSGDITTTGDALTFTGPVRLDATVAINTTSGSPAGANVTFASTLNALNAGVQGLTLNLGTGGDAAFDDAVGATTRLGAVNVTNARNVTAAAAFNAASFTQSAGQGITSFLSTLNANGAGGISITSSSISLAGAVTSTGGAIAFTGPTSLGGNVLTNSHAVAFNGATTLVGNRSINTANSGSGANVTFASTLNGTTDSAQSLTINAGTAGDIAFSGVVGGTTRLGAVTITNADDLTASAAFSALSFLQSAGQGLTRFLSTLNLTGASGGSISTASISLGGTVTSTGGPLAFNAPTSLGGNIVTNSRTVAFNGPVTLVGNRSITTANAGSGANVTFASTLDGTADAAQSLTINAGTAGDIAFTGAVGGATRPGAIAITNARNVTASAAFRALSFAQAAGQTATTFNGILDTSGPAGFAFTGAALTFNDDVTTSGGGAITVANSGLFTIASGAPVNASGGLSQTASGPVSVGANVTAAGAPISFAGPVTFAQPVELLAGSVTFLNSAAAGNRAITLTADEINLLGGANSFSGSSSLLLRPTAATVSIDIGSPTGGSGTLDLSDTDLAALADGFSAITIGRADGQHTIVIGSATFRDPTTIRTPSGGSITVAGALTSAGNASFLLDGSGATTFLNAPIITDGDNVTIDDTVIVGAGASIDTGAGPGNVLITGPVDGANALPITAGAGTVTLQQALGSTTPLASVAFSGSAISLPSVRTTGSQTYTGPTTLNGDLTTLTSGAITIDGPLTLAAGAALTTAGASGDDLTVTGTTDGPHALTVNAGGGMTTFAGAIGASARPTSINATAAIISLPSVDTDGPQTYTGATTLNGDLTAHAAGTITLAGPATLATDLSITTRGQAGDDTSVQSIDGPHSLAIAAGDAAFTASGAIGAATPLTQFSADAASIDVQSITTTFGQTLTGALTLRGDLTNLDEAPILLDGPVTLEAPVIITNSGTAPATVTITGTIDGANPLTISAPGAVVSLDSEVGATTPPTALTITAASFTPPRITTAGPQAYNAAVSLGTTLTTLGSGSIAFNGPVSLLADSTLATAGRATDGISFAGTLDGAFTLTLSTGAGPIAFAQPVGASTPLASLLVPSSGAIDFAAPVAIAGSATITNAGTMTNGPAAPLAIGGAFTQNGAGSTVLLSSLDAATVSFAGPVSLGGDIASDTVSFAAPVTLIGDQTITADTILFAAGANSDATPRLLTTDAATSVRLTGGVGTASPLRSFVQRGAGVVILDGDLTTTTGLTFAVPVLVASDSIVQVLGTPTLTDSIVFLDTVDSLADPRSLTLLVNPSLGEATPGLPLQLNLARVEFHGPVGGTAPLDNLHLMFSESRAVNGRIGVPAWATIWAPKGMSATVVGDFRMGQNEKLSALGAISLTAGGSVTLGDLSAMTSIAVKAPDIFILSRASSQLHTDAGILDVDDGVDFVAGQSITFSVRPLVLGSGPNPTFATDDGAGGSPTVTGFPFRAFGGVTAEVFGPGLDLRSSGPTNANVSEAIAGAAPRESQSARVSQDTAVGRAARDELEQLGLAPRDPDLGTLIEALIGRALYNDVPRLAASSRAEVTVNRLSSEVVQAVLDAYRELLLGVPDDDDATDGEGTIDLQRRLPLIAGALTRAIDAYDALEAGDAFDPVEFRRFVASTPEHADAARYLEGIDRLLRNVELLGLSPRERQIVRSTLFRDVSDGQATLMQTLETLVGAAPVAVGSR